MRFHAAVEAPAFLTLCTLPQHHPESIRVIQTPELHCSSFSLKRRRDPRIDLAADVMLCCDPDCPAPSVSTALISYPHCAR